MDEVFGVIFVALELIAYYFIERRPSREVIEAAAFHPEEDYPEEMIAFATAFLGLGVMKVHQKDDAGGATWLLELVPPKKRRKNVLALVYHIEDTNWSTLAALRPRVPANLFIRRNADCTLGRLAPLPRVLRKAFSIHGWKAFADKEHFPDAAFLRHLSYSLHAPDNRELCGLALTGPYLVLWSDRGKVKQFLKAGSAFGGRLFSPVSRR